MLDLIFGKRELGKTTLAVSLTRNFSTRVTFDPRHMIDTTSDILTDQSIEGVLYEMLDDRTEIVIRPHFNTEFAFNAMCKEIYAWMRDNPDEEFCLLIDEARFVKNPEENRYFDFIVRCKPRSRTTVIMTSHGVVDVDTNLRRIADFWILFQMTLEADIERIRERCGNIVAQQVKILAPYEYIVWNDSNSKWRKHNDPTKWFVDIGAQKAIAS